jgi:hypothetical protein
MPTIRSFHETLRALSLVLGWAKLHQNELLTNWQWCQTLQRPNPIPPWE